MPRNAPAPLNPLTFERAWPIYRRLLNQAIPYWPLVALAMLAMALDAACTAGFAALTQPLLDDALLDKNLDVIRRLPLWIAAIFIGRGLGSFVADYCMAAAGRSVIRDLRRRVFEKYLKLPTAYYDRQSRGQMLSRLTYNVEQVAEAVTNAVTVVVRDSLYILGFLALMFYHSLYLTLAALVIGPIIATIIAFVSRRFRRLSRKIQDTMGTVTQRASEIVFGHQVVKLYGGQHSEAERFDEVNRSNRRQHLKLVATKSGSATLVQLLAGLMLAIIVFLATRDAMLDQITPGAFTSFMTAMLGILPSLKKLTNVHVMIQRGVAAADSIFALLDETEERGNIGQPLSRASGELRFEEVGLRYQPNQEPALEGVSFSASPGTVTALVGRSGSGKTSLVGLIARFYEPTSGRICLDGGDIATYRLDDLRNNIALVSQDVVLFDDTIAHNIAYGALEKASPKAIAAAARRANAMEFIEDLPRGIDTRLGEGGTQLSGGQRQRIAIARAILKDAPILILDEATSALDSESERLIQTALEGMMRTRTTLVIAHRLSTVESADQVLVLDRGRLVEQGSHRELLARDGHYAALHRLQFQDPAAAGDGIVAGG